MPWTSSYIYTIHWNFPNDCSRVKTMNGLKSSLLSHLLTFHLQPLAYSPHTHPLSLNTMERFKDFVLYLIKVTRYTHCLNIFRQGPVWLMTDIWTRWPQGPIRENAIDRRNTGFTPLGHVLINTEAAIKAQTTAMIIRIIKISFIPYMNMCNIYASDRQVEHRVHSSRACSSIQKLQLKHKQQQW